MRRLALLMNEPEKKELITDSTLVNGLLKYQCRVRKRNNPTQIETIVFEAKSPETLLSQLQRDGYLVISISPITSVSEQVKEFPIFLDRAKIFLGWQNKRGSAADIRSAKAAKQKEISGAQLFNPVSTHEQITFATQLAALVEGGVPLLKALEIVKNGTKNKRFVRALDHCIDVVRSGLSFSHAIRNLPSIFPTVWVRLTEAGEKSGTFSKSLYEVAKYQESAARVKGKVVTAFIYPALLFTLSIAVLTFFLVVIIPKFEGVFKNFNVELPAVTKLVIMASNFVRHSFLLVIAGAILFGIGIVLLKKSARGKLVLDTIQLKLPLFGMFVLEVSLLRFARSLGTMLRAGVPIMEALEISARLAENLVIENAIAVVREGIQQGKSLSTGFNSEALFPPFFSQLVGAGEESGQLDRFLALTADYYEEHVNTLLARLTVLLEPMILIVVGSIIGVIVVATILPIVVLSTSAG